MATTHLLRTRPTRAWPDVFDELRRDMDTLFHRYGEGPSARPRGVFPPVNLYETAEAYVLTAELPGVEAGDVHVSLQGSTLVLEGERKGAGSPTDASAHRIERPTGSFRRAFDLPAAVDGDQAEASTRNGVLMLRLPKAPEHQPRRIDVRGQE